MYIGIDVYKIYWLYCVFVPIAELGDYDPYKHTPGYVSEYRFVPDQKEEHEDAIEQIHKTLM